MKQWTISLFVLTFLFSACNKQKVERPTGMVFTDEVRLKTTPVKNQGHTSFCWIYAMLATIETEHIMQGDSINLSVDYVARAFLREQAMEDFIKRREKKGNAITERGMATMTLQLIQTYGLTHYDAFHRRNDTNIDVLSKQLFLAEGKATTLSNYIEHADLLLDKAFGEVVESVFFLGSRYTHLEFAHSVCREDEYEALTSFTHHPYNERFALEVPDNKYHDTYLNVPIDTLYYKVVSALRHGHPVCWEGDISEPGFSFRQGIAILPSSMAISQANRQEQFESGETTDDHCMTIIGLAHDQQGRRYFLMKNSWGTNNRYGGFMYVSEDYLRMKTIAVILPQE